MKKVLHCFLLILMTVLVYSCKKENAILSIPTIQELYPLAVGKTFTYRMDSTIPASFGTSLLIKSYLAKDIVDSSFSDASGRPSFRIYRYITDTLGTQPWKYTATYYATYTATSIEYMDNYLRFIPLVTPVSYNTLWLGNSYINTPSPSPYYFLDNWQYGYQNIDQPYTVLKGTINNTTTVLQHNDQNPAVFDPSVYNNKDYSIEVYAKGVGLIYKDFIHYIYQTTPAPKFQDDSYGIRLNLIDYQ